MQRSNDEKPESDELISFLISLGVNKNTAEFLASEYSATRIASQIYQMQNLPDQPRNPGAWLHQAIMGSGPADKGRERGFNESSAAPPRWRRRSQPEGPVRRSQREINHVQDYIDIYGHRPWDRNKELGELPGDPAPVARYRKWVAEGSVYPPANG